MSDTKERLQRARERFTPPEDVMGSLIARREHRERKRRVSAAIVAIVVAVVSFGALARAFHGDGPAIKRIAAPTPEGIFSEVGGWIAFGNQRGIWAVDPSHPGDRESQIQLSANEGIPLAWSSDGSKLLISRGSEYDWSGGNRGRQEEAPRRGLFVLHADGTETRLVRDVVDGASFSPDGTTVVFARGFETPDDLAQLDGGIYLIDADGGRPKLLVAPGRRYIPEQDRSYPTDTYFPAFSPDGTQIAFFDGFGDNSHSLRVVDADGGDLRVLIDSMEAYRISGLVWSPDGTHLAFGRRLQDGIYTIGVDGSGLTLVIPFGVNPYWSPDGSRISFEYDVQPGGLNIADQDGSRVQSFGYAASGPWNPLVQPEPAEMPAAASEGLTLIPTLPLVVALLALVGGAVLLRRRMGATSGT